MNLAHYAATLYQTYLEPSFPARERPVEEVFVKRVLEGDYLLLPSDNALVVLQPFPHEGVVVASWIATHPTHRSSGAGTRALDGAKVYVRQHYPHCLFLAEVEHASATVDHPLHGDPRARLRFYHKNGARLLPLYYPYREAQGSSWSELQLIDLLGGEELPMLPLAAWGRRTIPEGPQRKRFLQQLQEGGAVSTIPLAP